MTEFMVADTRRAYQGSIAPAVHSRDIRERVLPQILELPFVDPPETNPLELAADMGLREILKPGDAQLTLKAMSDGIAQMAATHGAFEYGYADRQFTGIAAATIGMAISEELVFDNTIEHPLSLTDHGRMYQTSWFGSILNQLALTRPGLLGEVVQDFKSVTTLEQKLGLEEVDLLEQLTDKETGRIFFDLTDDAVVHFRSLIPKGRSMGCPVARKSFIATPEQAKFLADFRHVNLEPGAPSQSGFVHDRITEGGMYKFTQGENTAIDDLLNAWGDYVLRYSDHLLNEGNDPKNIAATYGSQILLLT